MKTISFQVSDLAYERLLLLKDGEDMTWRQFFLACVAGYIRRGIELQGRRGSAYKRDLQIIQRELLE